MKPDTLWVPERIANALVRRGFGARVASFLIRVNAVPKSAFSSSNERPTPNQHFQSMAMQGSLAPPDEIVLVDDIVTRGHTPIGAANRLLEAFPSTRVRAFIAMRTISHPVSFSRVYDPKARKH